MSVTRSLVLGADSAARNATRRGWLPVAICLLLGVLLAMWADRLPPAQGSDVAESVFSGRRAMADVEVIARAAHPIGSDEIAHVRTYLLDRLRGLGLTVRVQKDVATRAAIRMPSSAIAGSVQNIIAELPGVDRALPSILIMAHYDTMSHSPGAGDDSSGVAVALEIARNLQASGPHRRSVFLLFTDGEEPGLLGSSAFFSSDPVRHQIGLVLNLEARGDTGRTAMFETSRENGSLIRLYAATVDRPGADSLSAAIYRHMPNDTDLTPALAQGMTGINLAFVGGQVAYHTALSTAARLDVRSLQHMGDQALAIVRAAADSSELPSQLPDPVYSDVLGAFLVWYPQWMGWVIATVSAILLAFVTHRLMRDRLAVGREFGRGALCFVLLLASNALMLQLGSRTLRALLREETTPHALLWNFDLLFVGSLILMLGVSVFVVAALARGAHRLWLCAAAAVAGLLCNVGGIDPIGIGLSLTVVVLGATSLGQPTSVWGAWGGMLTVAVAIGIAVQALLPAAGYLIAWPTLAALIAACAVLAFRTDIARVLALVIVGAIGAIALGQIGIQIGGFFTAIGPAFPPVIAAFAPIAALVLLPLMYYSSADRRSGAVSFAVMAVGFILMLGASWLRPGAPRVFEVFYLADLEAGRFFRASLLRNPDEWSRALLSSDGQPPRRTVLEPAFKDGVWLADARPARVRGAAVTIEKSQIDGRLNFHLRCPNGGRRLQLFINPSVDLSDATVEGRAVPLTVAQGRWVDFTYHAMPDGGVTLSFGAPVHGAIDVRVIERIDGWPAGFEPSSRPPNLMPWRSADSTLVLDRARHAW